MREEIKCFNCKHMVYRDGYLYPYKCKLDRAKSFMAIDAEIIKSIDKCPYKKGERE